MEAPRVEAIVVAKSRVHDATAAYFPRGSRVVQYLDRVEDVLPEVDSGRVDIRLVGSSLEAFEAAVKESISPSDRPRLLLRGDVNLMVMALSGISEALLEEASVTRVFQEFDHAPSRAAVNSARDGLEAWDRLRERYGVLTAAELADRAGSKATNRSSYANDLIRRGRAFAVKRARASYLPAYQFDETGNVYPAVPLVLETFRDAGWSDFSIAIWFANPTTWLSGQRPADLLPEDQATQRVTKAARRTAQA